MSVHGALLERLMGEHLSQRYPSALADRNIRILVTPGGPDDGAVGAALLGAYRVAGA
jgi:hypothetical protein